MRPLSHRALSAQVRSDHLSLTGPVYSQAIRPHSLPALDNSEAAPVKLRVCGRDRSPHRTVSKLDLIKRIE